MKEKTEAIKVGDPFEEGVFHGAQALKSQFDTVLEYIEKGKKKVQNF